jgi:hypothetical protein
MMSGPPVPLHPIKAFPPAAPHLQAAVRRALHAHALRMRQAVLGAAGHGAHAGCSAARRRRVRGRGQRLFAATSRAAHLQLRAFLSLVPHAVPSTSLWCTSSYPSIPDSARQTIP